MQQYKLGSLASKQLCRTGPESGGGHQVQHESAMRPYGKRGPTESWADVAKVVEGSDPPPPPSDT